MKRCPDCPYETKRKYEYVFHRLEQHENFPILKDDPMIKCGIEECTFQADDELKFVNHVQSKHNPDGVSIRFNTYEDLWNLPWVISFVVFGATILAASYNSIQYD